MTKNKPLYYGAFPWTKIKRLKKSKTAHSPLFSAYWDAYYDDSELGYFVHHSHAEMFRELTRRIVKRENFTEYANMVWKEVFQCGN